MSTGLRQLSFTSPSHSRRGARRPILLAGLALGLVFALGQAEPRAQGMISEPWNFSPQNRASLAIAMKQFKDAGNDRGVSGAFAAGTSSISGSGNTILCGGGGGGGDGGSASATANSTCIILNNATGSIATGQESNGDQTGTNSVGQTASSAASSDADAVLDALAGN